MCPTEWFPLPSVQVACSAVTPSTATSMGTNQSFCSWVVCSCSNKLLRNVTGLEFCPKAGNDSNTIRAVTTLFIPKSSTRILRQNWNPKPYLTSMPRMIRVSLQDRKGPVHRLQQDHWSQFVRQRHLAQRDHICCSGPGLCGKTVR